jgi:hypothetical protein
MKRGKNGEERRHEAVLPACELLDRQLFVCALALYDVRSSDEGSRSRAVK